MKTDILFLDLNEYNKDPTRAGVVLEPANHRSALEPSSLPAYVFFFQKFKNNVDAGKLFVLFFYMANLVAMFVVVFPLFLLIPSLALTDKVRKRGREKQKSVSTIFMMKIA